MDEDDEDEDEDGIIIEGEAAALATFRCGGMVATAVAAAALALLANEPKCSWCCGVVCIMCCCCCMCKVGSGLIEGAESMPGFALNVVCC